MKILFFDTESTDLSASWGRILCCSFASAKGEAYTFRYDKPPFKGNKITDDSALVTAIRDELETADIIVGWNSILHDIALLNSRLALAKERPLMVGERHGILNIDLMYYAGGQSNKIGGRRLDTVAKFFRTKQQKTALDGQVWQDAAVGDEKAMDQIVEHCEFDTLVLRELWPKLAPSIKKHQFTLSEVWQFLDKIPSRKS